MCLFLQVIFSMLCFFINFIPLFPLPCCSLYLFPSITFFVSSIISIFLLVFLSCICIPCLVIYPAFPFFLFPYLFIHLLFFSFSFIFIFPLTVCTHFMSFSLMYLFLGYFINIPGLILCPLVSSSLICISTDPIHVFLYLQLFLCIHPATYQISRIFPLPSLFIPTFFYIICFYLL